MQISTKTNSKQSLWSKSHILATFSPFFHLSTALLLSLLFHLSYRDSPVALLRLLQGKAPLNGLGAACPCIFNGHARHAEVSAWIMYGGWVVEKREAKERGTRSVKQNERWGRKTNERSSGDRRRRREKKKKNVSWKQNRCNNSEEEMWSNRSSEWRRVRPFTPFYHPLILSFHSWIQLHPKPFSLYLSRVLCLTIPCLFFLFFLCHYASLTHYFFFLPFSSACSPLLLFELPKELGAPSMEIRHCCLCQ